MAFLEGTSRCCPGGGGRASPRGGLEGPLRGRFEGRLSEAEAGGDGTSAQQTFGKAGTPEGAAGVPSRERPGASAGAACGGRAPALRGGRAAGTCIDLWWRRGQHLRGGRGGLRDQSPDGADWSLQRAKARGGRQSCSGCQALALGHLENRPGVMAEKVPLGRGGRSGCGVSGAGAGPLGGPSPVMLPSVSALRAGCGPGFPHPGSRHVTRGAARPWP